MNENERILDPNSIRRGTAFCIRASPPKSYHIKAARIPPRLSAKVRWSPHLDNPKVHLAGKVQKINSTPHFVCRRLLVKHVLHHSYILISHIFDGTQSLSSLRLSDLDRVGRLVAAEAQRYASNTFKATTLSRSDQSGRIESIEEWHADADEVRN